jgi:hypothetical protein
MKYLTILLFALFVLKSQGQKSLDEILDELYSLNKLSIKGVNGRVINQTFKISDNNEVDIFFDSVGSVNHIARINNIYIDTILAGNEKFTGKLNGFEIDTTSCGSFVSGADVYYYLPLVVPNCNGLECRVFSCLLIAARQSKIFFFTNLELQARNYFRINDKSQLVYLDVNNSFSDPNTFTKWLKNDSDFFFKISPLFFDEETSSWKFEMTKNNSKNILIKTKSQYDYKKCEVVELNW